MRKKYLVDCLFAHVAERTPQLSRGDKNRKCVLDDCVEKTRLQVVSNHEKEANCNFERRFSKDRLFFTTVCIRIFNHGTDYGTEYLLGCVELLKKLLNPDPTQRISMDKLMQNEWINEGYKQKLCPAPFPNKV